KFEFTNIKCASMDKSFSEFEYCFIKSVNRSYKYISMRANLHRKPIAEASASLYILRRFKTYTPITMNVTFDICKYMATKKNSGNPMLVLFEETIKIYSNANHKCPFDVSCKFLYIYDYLLYTFQHDIIIDKLPTHYLDQHFTRVLPFPPGDYAFYSSWISHGSEKGTFKIYATIS
ncbi:hypothetical protein KR009_004594, partial [Drosophila setifemur]